MGADVTGEGLERSLGGGKGVWRDDGEKCLKREKCNGKKLWETFSIILLPSPRLKLFWLLLLIPLGNPTPTLRIRRMQTLLHRAPHPNLLCTSPSLDKNQTSELLLMLGVGKGEGLPGQ